MSAIRVAPAYQGIPGIAHGGFVAGLMVQHAREPLRVMLRQPPPLDTPLSIEDAGEALALRDPQGGLIMEGHPAGAVESRLPVVTVEEARFVPPAYVWAVVDCLTAWSFADRWDDAMWWPAVTGQIAVTLAAQVRPAEPYVLVGRLVGREGRRVTIEAAVGDADGRVFAHAEVIWIVVPTPPAGTTGTAPSA
jgi:hypothetical protein